MSTSKKCMNTPECWSCSAPVCIELAQGVDRSKFPHARGLIYEGNTLRVTTGMIRQGYETTHLSVYLPQCKPFPIAHADIIRVMDVNGTPIMGKRHVGKMKMMTKQEGA